MTEQFLLRKLSEIDRSGMTVRDVLILHTIMVNPGICGKDVADKLGHTNRSSVECGLRRLLGGHLIEDRREIVAKASPSAFYVLFSGIEYWEQIKS